MDMQEFINSFHFVNGKWVLILPSLLMLMDFLTGFVGAWSRHDIDSSKMRSGLAKKFGEIAAIVIAEMFAFGMKLPPEIVTGISLYICVMELVSNAENIALLGVPIPTRWADKLKQVKNYYEANPEKRDKRKTNEFDDSVLEIEHSASEDSEDEEKE